VFFFFRYFIVHIVPLTVKGKVTVDANFILKNSERILPSGSMYTENSRGPKTDPCGSP